MATKVHTSEGWLYDPILPDPETWPIVQLSHNREAFIDELVKLSIENIKESLGNNPANIKDELARTLYTEKIRLSQTPWKADGPDEKEFWSNVKKDMVRINAGHENPNALGHEDLIHRIVKRYAEEIAGIFDVKAYNFAKRFITSMFSRLLNASQGKGFAGFFDSRHNLHDKIHLVGEIDHVRELAKEGTVIIVPTHSSNLDSMLIGWAIQSIGLPPVLYGAGLNLFGIKIMAWFMNRLGAYKVDRRKKNTLYLETLKMYSELSLRKGCNGLFFPGGTRARDGMLEKRLKLGLLGTALQAQRMNFVDHGDEGKKIFVVPVTINYNFVLEAQSLIDQHLKRSGQELYYVENDDFSTSSKMLRFIYNFFTATSEMAVRFGKPMDLFGNRVDEAGISYDPTNNEVDIKKYFYSNGEISKDGQRDAEYTRMLGEKIVERYHIEALVFSSQILAYAAFRIIKARHSKMDLYGLMRLPSEDLIIRPKELMDSVGKIVVRLRELNDNGEVQIEKEIKEGNIASVVKKGIANLGVYHAKLPLMYNTEGDFQSQDIKILYFYHNRLEGYGLHKYI